MDILYWLWLSTLPRVGPITQKRLLVKFKTPVAIFNCSEQELNDFRTYNTLKICDRQIKTETLNQQIEIHSDFQVKPIIPRITTTAITSILQNRSLEKAKQILEKASRQKINILTFDNLNYPIFAKNCPESPTVLYYKGRLKNYTHTVGIVGSRRCTKYGQNITVQIARDLSKRNIPIISGLAKGIDGYAHTAALKYGGETIAFLGNGVDICYPPEHRKLYEGVIENGAVLSQYPPGVIARPQQFLQRNALISAWSKQVIIVEAGAKSGALTTAQFAKKYGREIFALPNQIDIPEGKGANQLLVTTARPYLGIESLQLGKYSLSDVSTKDPLKPDSPKNNAAKYDESSKDEPRNHKPSNYEPSNTEPSNTEPKNSTVAETQLLEFIKNKPMRMAEAARYMKMTESELNEMVFFLELDGKIKITGELIVYLKEND